MKRAMTLAQKRLAVAGTALALSLAMAMPAFAQAAPGFNIPTDAPASPLTFNGQTAQPFTVEMPLFEEFGPKALPGSTCPTCVSMPVPATCDASPDSTALDNFL